MEILSLAQSILAGSTLVSVFGFLVFSLYPIIYRLLFIEAVKGRVGALSETRRQQP